MPAPDAARPSLLPAICIVIGVTLWRLGFLAFNGTDLFVDEAQYWLWGQNLDFGYYSKPPMIGWLIRAVTEIAGSDAPFWVRAPAPVLHMITAFLLMALANLLYGARAAAWAGPVYVALPFVTVGSALMSTDTVMLPFFALALWMYFRLARAASARDAALMGAALGLGLMSKYAAVYFVLGAALAQPAQRLRTRDTALAAAVALCVAAPNIWWNLTHDAATVRHTMDNAGWGAAALHVGQAAEFLIAQFAVFGPVLFAGLLWMTWRGLRGRLRGSDLTLLLFSAPVVALIVVQALLSKAYANWAVAAYAAGTVLVVAAFQARRTVLIGSQALHLGLALALPVLMITPEAPRLDGKPLLARYIGIADVSRRAQAVAETQGVSVLVAQNRSLLADLYYTLRDTDLRIYALPRPGQPGSYYEQVFPVPASLAEPALFLTDGATAPCTGAQPLAEWQPAEGAYARKTLRIFRLAPGCLNAGES
ncbi:ArnT family glycosyltransferase [Actibacterium sp. D379-3]